MSTSSSFTNNLIIRFFSVHFFFLPVLLSLFHFFLHPIFLRLLLLHKLYLLFLIILFRFPVLYISTSLLFYLSSLLSRSAHFFPSFNSALSFSTSTSCPYPFPSYTLFFLFLLTILIPISSSYISPCSVLLIILVPISISCITSMNQAIFSLFRLHLTDKCASPAYKHLSIPNFLMYCVKRCLSKVCSLAGYREGFATSS